MDHYPNHKCWGDFFHFQKCNISSIKIWKIKTQLQTNLERTLNFVVGVAIVPVISIQFMFKYAIYFLIVLLVYILF